METSFILLCSKCYYTSELGEIHDNECPECGNRRLKIVSGDRKEVKVYKKVWEKNQRNRL